MSRLWRIETIFLVRLGADFYRGRLDGSAKILCIASDPGPTERIAGRTLVGDAGQRVQGFLNKIGLTRSYLCLNAFSYALFPGKASQGDNVLTLPDQLAWRNELFDMARGQVLAVVAFGTQAKKAVALWSGKTDLPVFYLPHPSSHNPAVLLQAWRDAVPALRALIPPDADGNHDSPNYASTFKEADYAPIPRYDLPFGVPDFLGNDAWLRAKRPPKMSSVKRPSPDDRHTLIWVAPKGS